MCWVRSVFVVISYRSLARERLVKIEEATTSFEANIKKSSEAALSPKSKEFKENEAILLIKTYYTHPGNYYQLHSISNF
jgi:hypothetical protein